jgi:hypothetical protein
LRSAMARSRTRSDGRPPEFPPVSRTYLQFIVPRILAQSSDERSNASSQPG